MKNQAIKAYLIWKRGAGNLKCLIIKSFNFKIIIHEGSREPKKCPINNN